MMRYRYAVLAWLSWTSTSIFGQPDEPLIVVEDRDGTSALPYYQALNLQPRAARGPIHMEVQRPPSERFSEAAMLPVRSTRLTPGRVDRRVIEVPGLRPLILVGDDEASRTWLRQRASTLRDLGAVGMVVNVETPQALAALREIVPDVTLAPASGDDLAVRLALRHYPVLITATGIEQ